MIRSISTSQPAGDRPATTPRRHFLKLAVAAAGVGLSTPPLRAAASRRRPGQKLRLGLIGTSGRGRNMIRDLLQLDEDVIALCDVDPARLAEGAGIAAPKYAGARQYRDYRKMLEQEKELDAVIVTTPDHMHAPISLLAMSRGLHVFCEKPLARTVGEARRMRELARTTGVVTQMGTQGSASHALRRAVEVIRAGVLGTVREVHVWTDRTPKLQKENVGSATVPAGMNWDDWIGVAPPRPYSRNLHPFAWRWWTGFGTGPLGDMACHLTNIAFRALDLMDPTEIDVSVGAAPAPGMFGAGSRIVYRFPERVGRKPVTLTWYDGGRLPDQALLEAHGIPQQFGKVPGSEKLIIGDRGVLYGDAYLKLNGEPRFNGVAKHPACLAIPESIARARQQGTLGHYQEWIEACKGNGQTYAGFEVAAAHTEMVTLGTVALQLGRRIRWDPVAMRVPGEPAADALLQPTYRPGFTLA
ncbi:MAG: Gfo/Idh/MocA family oxidoreductase [Verrucomicrobia bacterium]|nr:Gfo/Idh/MocA family oxidoreductase [Verrucomicrobiota bacterium]